MIKKVLLFVIALLVISGAIIGSFVFKDINQEEMFNKEINELWSTVDDVENIDLTKIDARLNNIVTKGDYAVVEKSIKSYVYDYLHEFDILKVRSTLNDPKIYSLLSFDNYKTDGKAFVATKEYLTKTIDFLNNSKSIYNLYTSEEKIMSYIANLELNDYYINLYKTSVSRQLDSVENEKFINSLTNIVSILNKTQDVINLLSSNVDAWQLDDNQITFSSEIVMNDYNSLLNNIQN